MQHRCMCQRLFAGEIMIERANAHARLFGDTVGGVRLFCMFACTEPIVVATQALFFN